MIAGSRPTKEALPDWFTGTVWQDPIVKAPEPASLQALNLAFEPGAHMAWHTHTLGQTFQVVSGVGLVGLKNECPQNISTGMDHIVIQEALDGRVTESLEKVSDEDYSGLAE